MPFGLYSGGDGYISGLRWFVDRCMFLSFGMGQGILGHIWEKSWQSTCRQWQQVLTIVGQRQRQDIDEKYGTPRRMLWFVCLLHPLEYFSSFFTLGEGSQANMDSHRGAWIFPCISSIWVLYVCMYVLTGQKKGDGELNSVCVDVLYSTLLYCMYVPEKIK